MREIHTLLWPLLIKIWRTQKKDTPTYLILLLSIRIAHVQTINNPQVYIFVWKTDSTKDAPFRIWVAFRSFINKKNSVLRCQVYAHFRAQLVKPAALCCFRAFACIPKYCRSKVRKESAMKVTPSCCVRGGRRPQQYFFTFLSISLFCASPHYYPITSHGPRRGWGHEILGP